MATPYYGTMTLQAGNATSYRGIYFSDAAGVVNFDTGGGASATSGTFLQFPFETRITDITSNYAIGTQSTKSLTVQLNGQRQPIQLFMTSFGKDLSTKTPLNVVVPANAKLELVQA